MKSSLLIIFLLATVHLSFSQNFKQDLLRMQGLLKSNNYAIVMTLSYGPDSNQEVAEVEVYKKNGLYKAKTKDFELLITNELQIAKIYEAKVIMLTEIGEKLRAQLDASIKVENVLEDIDKVQFEKKEGQVKYYFIPDSTENNIRKLRFSIDETTNFYKAVSFEQLNLSQDWEEIEIVFKTANFNKTFDQSFFDQSQFIDLQNDGYTPNKDLKEYKLINQLTK